ncbi:MAG: hypothetical protein NVS4B8_05230 [Herpetosiphon sp.]
MHVAAGCWRDPANDGRVYGVGTPVMTDGQVWSAALARYNAQKSVNEARRRRACNL